MALGIYRTIDLKGTGTAPKREAADNGVSTRLVTVLENPIVEKKVKVMKGGSTSQLILLASVAKANLERWEPASGMPSFEDVPGQEASVATEKTMI
ncbi:MAG: hypothetical protein ABJO88_00105 [Parasphingorhabdus sp.]